MSLKNIVVIVFLIYSKPIWAQKFKFEVPFTFSQPLSLEASVNHKVFRVHGQRFFPKGQVAKHNQPLIIAHGIFNSYGVTIKLAQYLQKQGYDVWVYNHPGFGQEGFITKEVGSSKVSLEGDYGLMSLVEGVGHVIKYVTQKTQQTPIFAGYSLGGMVLDLYLHGASQVTDSGRILFDADLSKWRQKSLQRAVYLGAPVFSFREMTRGLKILYGASYCYSCLFSKKDKQILKFGFGQSKTSVVQTFDWLSRWLPESIWGLVLRDIAYFKNMDSTTRHKLGQYLAQHFSNIHSDLVHDLARLSPQIEPSHLNSGLPLIDTFYIVGNRDGLANHLLINKYLKDRQKINPRHQLLMLDQVGHLDLMEETIIQKTYGPILLKWLLSADRVQSNCEKANLLN